MCCESGSIHKKWSPSFSYQVFSHNGHHVIVLSKVDRFTTHFYASAADNFKHGNNKIAHYATSLEIKVFLPKYFQSSLLQIIRLWEKGLKKLKSPIIFWS